MPHVVIAGGGISGLAAAHTLARDAPECHVTLLEAADRLGGTIYTVRQDGFIVEAGPDSFLASKPAGVELCRELGVHLVPPIAANRGSFVLHDGRLHPIPEGLTGLVPSRLEPLLNSDLFSPAGKARLAQEPEMPGPPDGDESLAAFVERRFGAEVYQRLIEPLMAGIYAGDGRQLSLLATFPQLREMEARHGSILRGVAASPAAPPSGPSGFLAPRTGMQEIVEALAGNLDRVDVRRGEAIQRVERQSSGWTAYTTRTGYAADAVILALPAAVAGRVLSERHPSLGAVLAAIPSASGATVSLAYRREDVHAPLTGFGYIIPRAENREALACTWVSSKWPERAPGGFVLLRVFLGRYGQERILTGSDDQLVALAREELQTTLGITAPPQRHWLFRSPGAMPQYLVGHRDRMAGLAASLARLPGLALAGNAYCGVGIPDCIGSGVEAATAVSRQLQAGGPVRT